MTGDARDSREHTDRQLSFYDSRPHLHLRADPGDLYAQRIVARVLSTMSIGRQYRVLEVGAGFGRFTFPLLEGCASVAALDLSPRTLAEFARIRDERGIGSERCRTICCDVVDVGTATAGEPFDAVLGFFFLHHVADVRATMDALRGAVAPGGVIAFVEPNRWNPLFLAQVLCCPDMSWREEAGMYRIGARLLESVYAAAGFEQVTTSRFGFFPPQIVNRSRLARNVEDRLERAAMLRRVLPFLLVSARAPAA